MFYMRVLCGVISFLLLNIFKLTNMSDFQQKALEHLGLDSTNPNFSITDSDIWDLSNIQAGYDICQKEYEEKLRWIPVEEKEAPNEILQMKLENGENRFGYFQDRFKTTSNVKGFDFIKVTHYRTLSFYNAT